MKNLKNNVIGNGVNNNANEAVLQTSTNNVMTPSGNGEDEKLLEYICGLIEKDNMEEQQKNSPCQA